MIKNKLFLIVSSILFAFSSNSQTNEYVFASDTINKLKAHYPINKVINYSSEFNYKFKISRNKLQIEVIENSTEVFLALSKHGKAVAYRDYDNYSALTKNKIFVSNNDVSYTRNCGNYEVDGIFYHDNKVCIYSMGFPKPGDNLKLSTTIKYSDSRYFSYIPLSQKIPVYSSKLTFVIPENIDIELIDVNFENYNIKKTKELLEKEKAIRITYIISNLPPVANGDIAGPTWVYPHIIVISKSFTDKGRQQPIFISNYELYKWYAGLTPHGSSSQKARAIAKILVKDNYSDQENIIEIFNWVKDNIRYIAFEDGIAGYKPEDADIVLENRYGDCKGMANMLKEMLTEVDIDARLCWIGTNRLAYDSIIPSLIAHNHMICAVKQDDEFVFLDATDGYSNYGETGDNIQGRLTIIENGSNFIIDTVNATHYSENRINNVYNMSYDNMVLNIEGKIEYTGEPRREIQYILNEYLGSKKEEFLSNIITNNENRLKVDTIGFWVDSISTNVYKINVGMTEKNAVFSHDGQLFVPLDINYGMPLPKIDTTRIYHYNLDFRILKHYQTVFTIPDSLKVSYLPTDTTKTIGNTTYSFSWVQDKNQIIYIKELHIRNRIIDISEFKQWNSFISEYNELGNQMIILKNSY
jgi:hypothetical protein